MKINTGGGTLYRERGKGQVWEVRNESCLDDNTGERGTRCGIQTLGMQQD